MTISETGKHVEPDLLEILCRYDSAAWCFVPVGRRTITCCTVAFLNLWSLVPAELPCAECGIEISSPALRAGITARGLNPDFLAGILDGQGHQSEIPQILAGNDGIRLAVMWTPTLGDDGLPTGRLIWLDVWHDVDVWQDHGMTSTLYRSMTAVRQRLSTLSPRERQILTMLYEGKTNKAIAMTLQISEKTVEKHRARVMQKLKVGSTSELIRAVCYDQLIGTSRAVPNMVSESRADSGEMPAS